MDPDDPRFREELARRKRASPAQLLFRCARRVNELARARVAERTGLLIRASHTTLFPSERVTESKELTYVDVDGEPRTLPVLEGGLAFTIAQTPVVYHDSVDGPALRVRMADGSERLLQGATLPRELSAHVFARDGAVREIHVAI